jgi:preprotein translocase subunit SecY
VIVQVWLARLITARGIGNGFALILATGIVATLPAAIAGAFELSRQGMLSTDLLLGCGLLAIALTALVVHMELARRKLEATFARQAGVRTIGGHAQLQFKLNSAGMVPTILASWLLLLPILAVNMGLPLPDWIMSHLAHGRPAFMILYGLAIVLCAFFYTAFLLSPEELAEDLQKHGGVIPGVEPGEATADHIDRVVSRINVIGAVYLAFMFLMPEILIAKWSLPFYLGGPSLLIVVCAILDLKTQFENARRKRLEAS